MTKGQLPGYREPNPNHLGWLLARFAQRVPGVDHAIMVSADGLVLSRSPGLSADRADQLAAITSGLVGLSQAAARVLATGALTQTLVEMHDTLMLLTPITGGSTLSVLAEATCDIGRVGYEMTLLADQAGQARAEPPDP